MASLFLSSEVKFHFLTTSRTWVLESCWAPAVCLLLSRVRVMYMEGGCFSVSRLEFLAVAVFCYLAYVHRRSRSVLILPMKLLFTLVGFGFDFFSVRP